MRYRAHTLAAAAIATALTALTPWPLVAQQSSSPVSLAVPGGTVEGTLLMPAAASGKVPVVLIIAGSGPTDRDGNSAVLPGQNNSHRMLAEALAAQGIASLRYDKRGIGASKVANLLERDLRFETFVQDAASWVSYLRNDARFGTITVLGHSMGSLIGMLAARAARADAFVSVAGVAKSTPDVLRDQLRAQLGSAPDLLAAGERVLASLQSGQLVDQPPPQLTALFRPSVQPFLMSWFKYVPATELERLTIPVLLIQGTTDVQVPVAEAKALQAAKPNATLKIVEGMNHVLKIVTDPAKQLASYGDPSLPLAEEVTAATTSFVKGIYASGVSAPRRPNAQRVSLRDTVMGEVDGVRLAIEYGRPSKRGRVIWGTLVPWGRWWMPGADEATTLTTSGTIAFREVVVPAGEYTLYTTPAASDFALLINRDTGQYHTVYNANRDLGRVPMTMEQTADTLERLTFAIESHQGGGVLKLAWDDRQYLAPFVVRR